MSFKNRLVIQVSLLFGLALFFGTLLWFIASRVSEIVERVGAVHESTYAVRRDAQELAALKEDETQADAFLAELNRVLPSRDKLLTFRSDIESLSRRYGLRAGFSFGAETAATSESPGEASFSMTLDGTFRNIIAFIADLETGTYLIEVGQVNVSGGRGGYSATLNGSVLFRL